MSEFKLWIAELSELMKKEWGADLNGLGYDPEAFREMFDDGLTPKEAWSEEVSAAAGTI